MSDNAARASFFAFLHKNVPNRRAWTTREALRTAIIIWIERTYHHRRRHTTLDGLTPTQPETTTNTPATQTA